MCGKRNQQFAIWPQEMSYRGEPIQSPAPPWNVVPDLVLFLYKRFVHDLDREVLWVVSRTLQAPMNDLQRSNPFRGCRRDLADPHKPHRQRQPISYVIMYREAYSGVGTLSKGFADHEVRGGEALHFCDFAAPTHRASPHHPLVPIVLDVPVSIHSQTGNLAGHLKSRHAQRLQSQSGAGRA